MDFPKIDYSSTPKKTDVLLLSFFQRDSEPKTTAKNKPKEKSDDFPLGYTGKREKDLDTLFERLRQSKHFRGKRNETDVLRFYSFGPYSSLLLLGLGPEKKFATEEARQAGAAVRLAQKRARFDHIAVPIDAFFLKSGA